jgi:hypothetical protein
MQFAPLLEIASVIVCFKHVASLIVLGREEFVLGRVFGLIDYDRPDILGDHRRRC